jgi:hypothetical protein
MAVLFLLLAFLTVVLLAAAGLENSSTSSATLFDRSFNQLTEGQLLILAAALGFLVAVGGGFGTLSEIALALRTGTPLVGLATWSLRLDARPVEAFPIADDADTAARLVLEAARSRRATPTRVTGDG